VAAVTVFPDAALGALAACYPERPARLRHALGGHPLLARDALAGLAARLPAKSALCLRGDVPIGVGREDVAPTGLDPAATLGAIERCTSWMVLRNVEQDPAYAALVDALLAEIAPAVVPATGPMLRREAFIFVSSPGAVTPLHFDPEHNILMQLGGSKTITLFPVADEAVVPPGAHESFQREGTNNLEWSDAFADRGTPVALAPGDAVYVPVKAPHWVRNGEAPSVSLSITWRSGWSLREGNAHGMNRLLRRAGLSPRAPRRFPADNRLKALGYRVIRKAASLLDAAP
jgi:hypothetical protein